MRGFSHTKAVYLSVRLLDIIRVHMKNWTLRFRQIDKENFNDTRKGRKSIETRAATTKYVSVAVGDTLTFVCGKDRFTKKIIKRYHWPDIDTMVKEIPF